MIIFDFEFEARLICWNSECIMYCQICTQYAFIHFNIFYEASNIFIVFVPLCGATVKCKNNSMVKTGYRRYRVLLIINNYYNNLYYVLNNYTFKQVDYSRYVVCVLLKILILFRDNKRPNTQVIILNSDGKHADQ